MLFSVFNNQIFLITILYTLLPFIPAINHSHLMLYKEFYFLLGLMYKYYSCNRSLIQHLHRELYVQLGRMGMSSPVYNSFPFTVNINWSRLFPPTKNEPALSIEEDINVPLLSSNGLFVLSKGILDI